MTSRTYYPVTFKCDDEVLFITQGFIVAAKGEPHDTAQIYSTAIGELHKAIEREQLSADAFEKGNLTVIERPAGTLTEYTDEQMDELLDRAWELGKYKLQRDSRIIVTMEGGFTGGPCGAPVNQSLDVLSDDQFTRVQEIVERLQTRGAEFEYAGWVGDFGYYVRIGDKDTPTKNMKPIFNGGPFSRTPVIVEELKEILVSSAARPESKPSSQPSIRRGGPGGTE